MKKILIIFLFSASIIFSQNQDFAVSYKLTIDSDCLPFTFTSEPTTVMTGEKFMFNQFELPDFLSGWQDFYNVLVGGYIMIPDGAIDENIEVEVVLSQLDCDNPGFLKDPSTSENTLFMFLGIRVVGENSDTTSLEEHYNFLNDQKAVIALPHSGMFMSYLAAINLEINAANFAYYATNSYYSDGLQVETVENDPDTTKIYLAHFSQIAGGNIDNVTNVKLQTDSQVPSEFRLSQNHPNPFNPSTKIEFSIPSKEIVELKVYNNLGKLVSELVNSELEQGFYSVNFDGSQLSSGVYYYTLKTESYNETKKMLLLK